mgnify:FL=1
MATIDNNIEASQNNEIVLGENETVCSLTNRVVKATDKEMTLQSLKYGSVIERFDIENIKTIPIVRPTEELSQTVTDIVISYMDKTYRAFNCEEKAIQMVEQEIEKWNKH